MITSLKQPVGSALRTSTNPAGGDARPTPLTVRTVDPARLLCAAQYLQGLGNVVQPPVNLYQTKKHDYVKHHRGSIRRHLLRIPGLNLRTQATIPDSLRSTISVWEKPASWKTLSVSWA